MNDLEVIQWLNKLPYWWRLTSSATRNRFELTICLKPSTRYEPAGYLNVSSVNGIVPVIKRAMDRLGVGEDA